MSKADWAWWSLLMLAVVMLAAPEIVRQWS